MWTLSDYLTPTTFTFIGTRLAHAPCIVWLVIMWALRDFLILVQKIQMPVVARLAKTSSTVGLVLMYARCDYFITSQILAVARYTQAFYLLFVSM